MKNETQHLMALQLRKFLSLVILPFIVGLAFQFNLSSTVFAKDKPSELVDQRSGSGLSSQTMLTENEQAWLDRKHTVRVRVGNVPPYHMSSPEPHGISVDYLKLIGKRFGINFNFVPSPIGWQEAVDDLTGERKWCDLLATIARTPEREKEISFTKDYIFSPWVIINRTDSKFVSIMQDLNGKNVAVERGFIILNLIKDSYPQIKIVAFDKSIDALRSVATGASDAYVGNLTGATYLIQNNGLNNLKIAAPTPFGTHNQAMGVRKDWPELTSIINKALMAMPDAEETEIRNRWLSIRYEYGVNMKQVLSWIAGLAAIFSLIFGVTFIWNRRLKTEIENRKQAEEKILEQRNLSSKYLQIAGVMMCALNSAGEVTLMNKKGLDILGYEDEQEILGKNWFDISLPKNVAADVKLVFHQLMSGNIQPVEYYENPILTKTGEERIVAFHNTVLRDKEDNISGILSSGEDITNRKREEE